MFPHAYFSAAYFSPAYWPPAATVGDRGVAVRGPARSVIVRQQPRVAVARQGEGRYA